MVVEASSGERPDGSRAWALLDLCQTMKDVCSGLFLKRKITYTGFGEVYDPFYS
jgi:hypothetical protein